MMDITELTFTTECIFVDDYLDTRPVHGILSTSATCRKIDDEYHIEGLFDPHDFDIQKCFAIDFMYGIWVKCIIVLHGIEFFVVSSFTLSKDEFKATFDSAKKHMKENDDRFITIPLDASLRNVEREYRRGANVSMVLERVKNVWTAESVMIKLNVPAAQRWYTRSRSYGRQLLRCRSICFECGKSECQCGR